MQLIKELKLKVIRIKITGMFRATQPTNHLFQFAVSISFHPRDRVRYQQ